MLRNPGFRRDPGREPKTLHSGGKSRPLFQHRHQIGFRRENRNAELCFRHLVHKPGEEKRDHKEDKEAAKVEDLWETKGEKELLGEVVPKSPVPAGVLPGLRATGELRVDLSLGEVQGTLQGIHELRGGEVQGEAGNEQEKGTNRKTMKSLH